MESNKITDPRPFIHLCHRHGYIKELTKYLFINELHKFLQVYVEKMNQSALPQIVTSLLEIKVEEDQIRSLINSIQNQSIKESEVYI